MNALHRCLLLVALLPWAAHATGVPQTHAHHAMQPGMSGMQEDMPGMEMPAAAPSTPAPSGSSAPHAKPPNDHVPPAPPHRASPPMPPVHMAEAMQMDDHAMRGMLLLDRLERRLGPHGDNATTWSAQAWLGGDIDRLWLDSEGERSRAGTHDACMEVLWGHAVAAFWDTRLGVRHDFGQGPAREWIAFGVEGLAPYWFEVNATFYAGPQGRTAARLEVTYDLLFTQRLILRPSLELNAYGRNDRQRGIRAGLSDAELGLRLRYEFSRRFAPYVGVAWTQRRGGEPVPPRRAGEPAHDVTWMAGVRFWF
jgi:copper resistance protein B